MRKLGIVLVDDHPIVRDGLIQVLSDAPGLRLVCACSNCAQAIAALALNHPEILLLDAALPDRDGVSAIPALLAASPQTRIVLFTATVGEERAVEALRFGAKAVLLKSTPAARLIETISAVAAGAEWIAPDAADAPFVLSEPPAAALGRLTPREREIADRVAAGARTKQIAWELGLAEGTVKLHISRAFRKLGVDSRVRLARLVAGSAGA